jgi:DNA ligase-1
MAAKKEPRREFLQLAKTYKPDNPKLKIAGYRLSEKLDGTRCFWDGGVTRGMKTEDVPYASLINPKTGKRKSKIKPIATGLWSRYGNPIMAPDKFLDDLPECLLDGELFAGRGNFQLCRSICAGDKPDPRFLDKITYACYSLPSFDRMFLPAVIKNSNMHCTINEFVRPWFEQRLPAGFFSLAKGSTFEDEYGWLCELLEGNERAIAHPQILLIDCERGAREFVGEFLDDILELGGEGVVIRDPNAIWTPKRVNALLKFKPWEDAEGVITGFTSGRLTDKGSKHLGKIGALILDYNGKRLELSGLTDEERLFADDDMREVASRHPGEDMTADFQGKHFKLGQTITFKYRELSDDGIPKEGRYWRKRDVE